MTKQEKQDIEDILLKGKPFLIRPNLLAYLETVTIDQNTTPRTDSQNRALHLFFQLLADELNNAGYSVRLVLEKKMEVDWTPRLIKELLWRPAQIAILGKASTTELYKSKDIDVVWEHLNRHLGEKFGVHVPFPVDPQKQIEQNQGYKSNITNTSIPYPEFEGNPLI